MDWLRHKMTLQEIIAELKETNPTLQTGSNESGYVQMGKTEYEATIKQWAENRLAKLAKVQAEAAKAEAKAALLERLGITAEEAALLLG
jgi:hypothetical protein